MIDIFEYLNTEDRISILPTNKYFLDTCRSSKFFCDRKLRFIGCLIKENLPPLSLFEDATTTYSSLTLENIKIASNSNEFWKKLGQTVTYVSLKDIKADNFCKNMNVLRYFKKVKYLTLACPSEHYWGLNFLCVPTNIEKLTLSFLDTSNDTTTILDQLQTKSISQQKNLEELLLINIDFKESMINFFTINKDLITTLDMTLEGYQLAQRFALIYFPNLKNLKLVMRKFFYRMVLDNFLDNQCPALEDLKLDVLVRGPDKKYDKLTHFRVSCFLDTETLSGLELQPNLTDVVIEFYFGGNLCFFIHEIIFNSNVRRLKLVTDAAQICTECLLYVNQSFPLLEHLELTDNETIIAEAVVPSLKTLKITNKERNSPIYIPFTLDHLSHLHELYLEHIVFKQIDLSRFPCCPNLKKLKFIVHDPMLERKSILKFLRNIPKIESLHFHGIGFLSERIFHILVREVINLKELIIDDGLKITRLGVSHLIDALEYLKCIQRIGRFDLGSYSVTRVRQLFDSSKTLKEVCLGDGLVVSRSAMNSYR